MTNTPNKKLIAASIILLFISLVSRAEPVQSPVKIATENWVNATNANGTGLFFDLAKRVYGARGLETSYQTQTYINALLSVHTGQNDMIFGVAASIAVVGESVLLSELVIFDEFLVLICRRQVNCSYTLDSLPPNDPLIEIGDYSYESVLEFKNPMIHSLNFEHGLKLLEDNPTSVFLYDESSLGEIRDRENFFERYHYSKFHNLVNYVAFTNSERGRVLKEIFDSEMKKFHQSGELAKLYEKWGFSYPESLQKMNP